MRDVGIGFGIVGTVAGAIIGAAAGPLGGVLGGLLGGFIGSALGVGLGALAGYLNDRRGGGGKLDEKRIAEVLKYLAGRKADSYAKIEGKNDSDDLARDAVRLWKQDPAKFPLDVDQRRILVMELIDGRVTEDDGDAVLDILERSSDADILTMFVIKDAVSESYKPGAASRSRRWRPRSRARGRSASTR
jgi:hypothetical protein